MTRREGREKMSKFSVKRISEDEREYRGHTIHIDTEINHGYYGRYIVGSLTYGKGFSTLGDAKAHIDRIEAEKVAQ